MLLLRLLLSGCLRLQLGLRNERGRAGSVPSSVAPTLRSAVDFRVRSAHHRLRTLRELLKLLLLLLARRVRETLLLLVGRRDGSGFEAALHGFEVGV